VVGKDLLDAYFADLLNRPPDPGAYATYLGKNSQDVYHQIRTSQERTNRVNQQNQELQVARDQAARIPGLEQQVAVDKARIEELEFQAADTEKALVALRLEVEKQAKEIERLTKELNESGKPQAPNIEEAIKTIGDWIKSLLKRGDKK